MPTQRRSKTQPPDRPPPPLEEPANSPDDESEPWQEVDLLADTEQDEARRRRIAERAYRRAEHRGFAPGQELDDWLAAEAEERESEGKGER